jgi:hypothetical protein
MPFDPAPAPRFAPADQSLLQEVRHAWPILANLAKNLFTVLRPFLRESAYFFSSVP